VIILEKPYVSEFLTDTIIQNDWSVLKNNVVKNLNVEEDAFKLVSPIIVKMKYENSKYPAIYSNSENAINWIVENLTDTKLYDYIRLFKDKLAFRNMLKDLYPEFYYKEITIEELSKISIEDLKYPFVVKPTVGFLSVGVHIVNSDEDWKILLNSLENEMKEAQEIYPKEVVDSSTFMIEEYIEGDEYAIDAYYDEKGMPVILNIYQHPFLDVKDVRDRLYLMSAGIMIKYMSHFALLLKEIGDKNDIRNFPFHMEVRITKDEKIIPIEVNPMRFAGWCTADVAKYAWGINVYEYFMEQKKPDWNEILTDAKRGVYYFSMAEVPTGMDGKRIKTFDYKKYLSNFSEILEFRQINFKNNPLFAVIFGHTCDKEELKNILELRTKDFINNS